MNMPRMAHDAHIAAVAALSTILLGGTAMASPIVILNDGIHENLIISRGEYAIRIFQTELEINPWPTPGGDAPNSLFLNFQWDSFDPTQVAGVISGNNLPPFSPPPLQTPSIYVPGGLRLEDMMLGGSTSGFLQPSYDPEFGDTRPAFIVHGTSPFSAFNLYSFSDEPDNKTAYIGFANADVTMFGYMQIERVNLLDWRLIGYAYDPTGAPIEVERLYVPIPPTLAVAGIAIASVGRQKRR